MMLYAKEFKLLEFPGGLGVRLCTSTAGGLDLIHVGELTAPQNYTFCVTPFGFSKDTQNKAKYCYWI